MKVPAQLYLAINYAGRKSRCCQLAKRLVSKGQVFDGIAEDFADCLYTKTGPRPDHKDSGEKDFQLPCGGNYQAGVWVCFGLTLSLWIFTRLL